MKKLFKSKQGFTLIELLVVIGILAVLAAIAIPSVAGLIDRANVSADATNASEMTNALERFTSEYELYCQDLASGRVNTANLDAAQGRVFNVTGADDRADIEALEGAGLNGKQIHIDTKYPTNVATFESVVENYMKTSSTTFTPKQSDCHFFYSQDCGVVVCAEKDASVTELNALIQSGKDAKGKELGPQTQWTDVTEDVSVEDTNNPAQNGNLIPAGATYISSVINDEDEFDDTYYYGGDAFPAMPNECFDRYHYQNIEYNYEPEYGVWLLGEIEDDTLEELHIVSTINGKSLGIIQDISVFCDNLTTIHFDGTLQQWDDLDKDFDDYLNGVTVICSDGQTVINY